MRPQPAKLASTRRIYLWYNRLRAIESFVAANGISFAPMKLRRQHTTAAKPHRGGVMIENRLGSAYSVLLADDDVGQLDVMRAMIEPLGFRTFLASDGEIALDIVRQEQIHVAMFDVHMPKLTGLETLELLRQFNNLLPVILITADSSEGILRRAFQAQACSVIPKPVSKNVVLYTLTRVLGRNYGVASADR